MIALSGEFTADTVSAVMGMRYDAPSIVQRTPLHIDYEHSGLAIPELLLGIEWDDPVIFNAIGSANRSHPDCDVMHLPVIDVDGGARTTEFKLGSKAVLKAAYRGEYTASSDLRDVLGDNGMELEVFDKHSRSGLHNEVGSIVLRSKKNGVFEVFGSTTEGHSHLYIQQVFSKSDHSLLLSELQKTGIISSKWLDMTEKEGASIVRTPWTEKDRSHTPS